jgi:hypothetical protein
MKRTVLILALLVMIVAANAQTGENVSSKEMNTLFDKNTSVKLGWFIGIDPGYTQFDGKDVWLGGLSVGMILNHNFTIGLSGRSWVNNEKLYYPDVTDTVGGYLDGGYGGLLLEYTLFPTSLVHVTFPVLIGGGGVSYYSKKDYSQWDNDEMDCDNVELDTDGFFVIEPGVRAEINLFKFMRLNAGVSYRYTAGFEMINTPKDLMNNFTATVGLKFGKF